MPAFENKLLQRKFKAYDLFNDAFSIYDSINCEWRVVKVLSRSKMQIPQLLNEYIVKLSEDPDYSRQYRD
jgi:hypothetical protein